MTFGTVYKHIYMTEDIITNIKVSWPQGKEKVWPGSLNTVLSRENEERLHIAQCNCHLLVFNLDLTLLAVSNIPYTPQGEVKNS